MIRWSGRDLDPRPVSVVALALTVLLCVVVGIPRFAEFRDVAPDDVSLTDQRDGWYLFDDSEGGREITGELSFDVYSYHAYVEHFRGDFDRYPIFGPWRWRLVPSWIAAWTPIENPADAYAAVSMAFLAVGGAALVAAAARAGLDSRRQMVVGALYAVSFPLVWYGTSGYVDGSLVASLCIALCLVQSRRWWLFLAFLPVGLLVKETFVLMLPVAVAHTWVRSRERRDWLPFTLAAIGITAVTFIGIRYALDTPRTLDWLPRWRRFSWNLTRPAALGSFVLTCGVAVPVAVYGAWRAIVARDTDEGREAFARNLHLIVGLGMGLAVTFHGFTTAYSDGRHAWTTYPFATILAVMTASEVLERRRRAEEVGSPTA